MNKMRIECDMCGKIYPEIADTKIIPNITKIGNLAEYHLCPECGEAIINMIKHHKRPDKTE